MSNNVFYCISTYNNLLRSYKCNKFSNDEKQVENPYIFFIIFSFTVSRATTNLWIGNIGRSFIVLEYA